LEFGDLKGLDFDLALTGFDPSEIAALEPKHDGEESPDIDLTPPGSPKSERGVVYQLGRHRVMCGDCRDFTDVERLMGGSRANIVVTSPPYASQRVYDESSGFRPIPADEYVEWYRDVAANAMAVLADDGSYFLNIKEHCDDGQRSLYVKDLTIAHVREWGWRFVDELIWHKQGMPGLYGDRFKNEFEPVFHFAKGACKTRFANVTTDSENVPSGSVGSNAEMQGKGDPLRGRGQGKALPGNVIWASPDSASVGTHEARFPVALPSFFIRAFSDAGDTVFDPFSGSGTTLVATEREGRVGFGMEISPAYVDVIRRRYAEFVNDPSLAP
jgi:site-specific DNA-methyltransferase (adenine-specific)